MKILNKNVIFRSPILIRDYEENPFKEYKHFFYRRHIIKALKEGKKMTALKICKASTGKNLKDTKEYVDKLCPKYLIVE